MPSDVPLDQPDAENPLLHDRPAESPRESGDASWANLGMNAAIVVRMPLAQSLHDHFIIARLHAFKRRLERRPRFPLRGLEVRTARAGCGGHADVIVGTVNEG